jgi:hypothetical protein
MLTSLGAIVALTPPQSDSDRGKSALPLASKQFLLGNAPAL